MFVGSTGCLTAPRRERDVLSSQEHRAHSGAPASRCRVDYKHPAPLGPRTKLQRHLSAGRLGNTPSRHGPGFRRVRCRRVRYVLPASAPPANLPKYPASSAMDFLRKGGIISRA